MPLAYVPTYNLLVVGSRHLLIGSIDVIFTPDYKCPVLSF